LTIRTICKLVGIPLERETWLRAKLDEFNAVASYEAIPRQWDQDAYFWQIIAERLVRPQRELLDVLIEAWKEEKLSNQELLGYLAGFTIGGTDTTGTGIVNVLCLLDECSFLGPISTQLDNSEVVSRAIEEVMRFASPLPNKFFFTLKQVQMGGLIVPKGSVVLLWLAAANRDEAVNGGVHQADPNRFDPARWPNRHISFGHSSRHYCLGAELARLEMRIALEEALRTLPGLHLDTSEPFKRLATFAPRVTQAPFRFNQSEAERCLE